MSASTSKPGAVVRSFYENITGSTVATLTGNAKFPANPDSQETLTSFDGGTAHGGLDTSPAHTLIIVVTH